MCSPPKIARGSYLCVLCGLSPLFAERVISRPGFFQKRPYLWKEIKMSTFFFLTLVAISPLQPGRKPQGLAEIFSVEYIPPQPSPNLSVTLSACEKGGF
jgi:hypothetical protein